MMNKGFTLLETLVVFVIIAILIAIALPYYFNAVERARMTEVVTLWGRSKNWISGQNISNEQANRVTKRLEQTKLKYFTGKIICLDKPDSQEICWEAEFTQQKENQHVRYKLVTLNNFMNLACVPLSNAGEDFCLSLALDENKPEQIGDEKGYTIY